MRSVWIVSLIAGCGFAGPDLPVGDDAGDPGGNGGSSGSGAGTGTGPGGNGSCDVQVGPIKLCLTFEHGKVVDLAVPPHPVTVALNAGSILRIASDAVALDRQSQILFGDSPDFNVRD